MTSFAAGALVGAWAGALVGVIAMACVQAGARADRASEKHADVDALAKQAKAYAVRSARIWSNVPPAPMDEHEEHLGAA